MFQQYLRQSDLRRSKSINRSPKLSFVASSNNCCKKTIVFRGDQFAEYHKSDLKKMALKKKRKNNEFFNIVNFFAWVIKH